ncbi:N-acetylmuramic acid 6-phosphate etherase [Verrucomicrobiaceae bacterium 227]
MPPPDTSHKVLGIEGGATKTDWIYLNTKANGQTTVLAEGRLPAANYRLISRESLESLLRSLPTDPTHVGIFLAGCATGKEAADLAGLAALIWPDSKIATGGDRESGYAACLGNDDGIVVISGTGSAVHGRRNGRTEKAGGWGQLLGDRGSGFDIAVHGLRHCLRMHDVEGRTHPLAQAVLRQLSLNSLNDLVLWAQDADKISIARLAPLVFEAAGLPGSNIDIILDVCARRLAEYAGAVASRLDFKAPPIRLLGSVFTHQAKYVALFKSHLIRHTPDATVEVCSISGAHGAAFLASQGTLSLAAPDRPELPPARAGDLATADTEQANPASAHLDELDTPALVDLFIDDQAAVTRALATCKPELEAAIDLVHATLEQGGRLFYIGAGTSGRLGVLDASEIPPTFSSPPELVQGIIAGGHTALHRAVEGAEDNATAGSVAMIDRGVTNRDLVCGITASGNTPFVHGALQKARSLGAKTILLTCNPARHREGQSADLKIDLPTGPELIAGSTRLKAGTATKLALNCISTCSMIRLGKVKGNLMIDLNASNEKLRDRAARMLVTLQGCTYQEARQHLAAHNYKVRQALEGFQA